MDSNASGLGSVESVARDVIGVNKGVYTNKLLRIIPSDILNKELTDDALMSVSEEIDNIRFEKQDDLAKSLGIHDHPEKEKAEDLLYQIINSPLGKLPKETKEKVVEIKFLFNVAATIVHQ